MGKTAERDRDHPVQVNCYSGYRGEETPRGFRLGNRFLRVTAVEARWTEPHCRRFHVLTEDGGAWMLTHDADGRWHARSSAATA